MCVAHCQHYLLYVRMYKCLPVRVREWESERVSVWLVAPSCVCVCVWLYKSLISHFFIKKLTKSHKTYLIEYCNCSGGPNIGFKNTRGMVSLSHSLTHSRTHSLPPSLPHSLTHSLTPSPPSHTFTPSHSHLLSLTHSFSLDLSLHQPHTHTLTHILTQSHSFSLPYHKGQFHCSHYCWNYRIREYLTRHIPSDYTHFLHSVSNLSISLFMSAFV